MPAKLYKLDGSPPARAAMMAFEITKTPVEMVDINILEGAHLTPDYLEKNPVHTIPLLEIDGLVLHDSHAMLIYLMDAYGKDESFYPKDLKQRTLVNQKLFFNNSILFPRLRSITYAALAEGQRKPTGKQIRDIDEAYGFVEAFLAKTKFMAADHVTIADLAAISVITSLVHLLAIDGKKYPKLEAWVKTMESLPYVQKCNAPGAAMLGEMIKQMIDLS